MGRPSLRVETLGAVGVTTTLSRPGAAAVEIASLAEDPGFTPAPRLVVGPYDDARTLVLLPRTLVRRRQARSP